ncbi:hypothetical protein A0256_22000 [Mucilaginibacter sp. PAMC 26640]|nr:hypothetical protein A0256_22000 [Mucilaginibacter sp. PAMC 26640]
MYVAYSAVRPANKADKQKPISAEMQLRIDAYQFTCAKYRQEINDIKKYLPNWRPAFNSGL